MPQRILVTGADGFIGKNLILHLEEQGNFQIEKFVKGDLISKIDDLIKVVDAVVHLAGENRPMDPSSFETTNVQLTATLCEYIKQEFLQTGRRVKFIFTSFSI